jgi:transcriptional regulator GlxA family with amidase domain
MRIAIPIYPGFAATDAIGPYEVLSRLPNAEVRFVATTPGLVPTDTGFLRVDAEPLAALAGPDIAPDILIVPGAPNRALPLADRALLDWLVAVDATSTWTASVCTGAYVLGAAGLLRGKRAVTHWLDVDGLTGYGATAVRERVVFDGKLVTAAGVSAGIDMALALAARIAGDEYAQAIQLGIEYDPQPPFDAGSPAKAPPRVVEAVRRRAAAGRA